MQQVQVRPENSGSDALTFIITEAPPIREIKKGEVIVLTLKQVVSPYNEHKCHVIVEKITKHGDKNLTIFGVSTPPSNKRFDATITPERTGSKGTLRVH